MTQNRFAQLEWWSRYDGRSGPRESVNGLNLQNGKSHRLGKSFGMKRGDPEWNRTNWMRAGNFGCNRGCGLHRICFTNTIANYACMGRKWATNFGNNRFGKFAIRRSNGSCGCWNMAYFICLMENGIAKELKVKLGHLMGDFDLEWDFEQNHLRKCLNESFGFANWKCGKGVRALRSC